MGEYRVGDRDPLRLKILTPRPGEFIVHLEFLVLRPGACALCRRPVANRELIFCESCGVSLHRRCYYRRIAGVAENILMAVGTDTETNKIIRLCQGCRS